jgi:hypothetical protein
MSEMPTNGAKGGQNDSRCGLRVTNSRTTILTNRLNDCYFVQVGRQIPTKGVEKWSLRVIKVELEEVDGA